MQIKALRIIDNLYLALLLIFNYVYLFVIKHFGIQIL
jgi:hypothetical protein